LISVIALQLATDYIYVNNYITYNMYIKKSKKEFIMYINEH